MYKSEAIGKGGIRARVVTDSTANGVRLTTFELRYHRYIHAELMTHRMFSRNASSSRAIPVVKMIEQVTKDAATPIHFGKNRPGMQAQEETDALIDGKPPLRLWRDAALSAKSFAKKMSQAGYHKQIVNRLIEPFQFINVVVTATEYDNFFHLRDHDAAQPEIRELARMMKQAMGDSEPERLDDGEWHLPYITDEEWLQRRQDGDLAINDMIKMSAARCARVSYLNHDKSQPNIEADLELYNMLATRPYEGKGMSLGEDDPVHLSPLEHQGTPIPNDGSSNVWYDGVTHIDRNDNLWSGNLREWIQHRQMVAV